LSTPAPLLVKGTNECSGPSSRKYARNTDALWVYLVAKSIRQRFKGMLRRRVMTSIWTCIQPGARIDKHDLPPRLLEQWQQSLREQQRASNISGVLQIHGAERRVGQVAVLTEAGRV